MPIEAAVKPYVTRPDRKSRARTSDTAVLVKGTLRHTKVTPYRIAGVLVIVGGLAAISVALFMVFGDDAEPTVPEPVKECDLSSVPSVEKRSGFFNTIVCPSGWSRARSTVYDSWPRDYDECVNYVGCEYAGLFHTIMAGPDNNCNAPAQMLDGGNPLKPVTKCRFPASVVGEWSLAATYGQDLELLGRKVKIIVPSQELNEEGKAISSCFVSINVADSCGVPEICDPVITEAPVLLDLEAQTACRIYGCDYTDPEFSVAKVSTVPKFVCYRDAGKADSLP